MGGQWRGRQTELGLTHAGNQPASQLQPSTWSSLRGSQVTTKGIINQISGHRHHLMITGVAIGCVLGEEKGKDQTLKGDTACRDAASKGRACWFRYRETQVPDRKKYTQMHICQQTWCEVTQEQT